MPFRIPQLPDYHFPVVVIEHPPKPRPPRQKPPRTPRQPHPPRGGHRHASHSGHSGHGALGSILSQLHHGARHSAHISGSIMGSLRSAHGHGRHSGPYSPHAGGGGGGTARAPWRTGPDGSPQPWDELQAQEWQRLGLNVTYTPPPNPTGVQKWHFGGHGAGSQAAQEVLALAHPAAPHQRAHHPRQAPHVSHHLPHHPSQNAGSSTHHAVYHPPIYRTPPHRHT